MHKFVLLEIALLWLLLLLSASQRITAAELELQGPQITKAEIAGNGKFKNVNNNDNNNSNNNNNNKDAKQTEEIFASSSSGGKDATGNTNEDKISSTELPTAGQIEDSTANNEVKTIVGKATGVADANIDTETNNANTEESNAASSATTTTSPTSPTSTASLLEGNLLHNSLSMQLLNAIENNLLADRDDKRLQAALLQRFWKERQSLQKLKQQADIIAKNEQKDVTEAENLYIQAMEMLSKPNSDKKLAYSLMRKSAEMDYKKARGELAWAHVLGLHEKLNLTHAAEEFYELAMEGVPIAHMGLAFLHAVGVGDKNVSQSLVFIHLYFAALGGETLAQMALGYRYLYGINVPASCEKSLSYYTKAATKVASKITFSNGPFVHRIRLLDEFDNPSTSESEIIDYYQLLADKGDVQSQVGLGQLYYQGGKAVQQDHQKALEYFTLAANAGNAIGYAFLGKIYLEGSEQIKPDNATAMKYFSKAATMGDPVGQSGLGLMYLKGLGVPKDTLKALTYFTQAADQGWVDGQLQLGNMYFTGNGVKTDYKLALNYFNLASQSGHVLAYYSLGIMHAYGLGTLRSCPTAVEFFKSVAERGRWSTMLMSAYSNYKNRKFNEAYLQYGLLAELGYEVAQSNSAFLLENMDVTLFNNRNEELIRAFYYWKRAATQDYSEAQVKLGDYYYYGWGTDVDYEAAATLYRKASEQQYNAQAMFNLGYMYEKGLGIQKDWHLAKRFYDLAAKTSVDAKVPVALALIKLQIMAKIEALKESPHRFLFFLDEIITPNWDLYLTTFLTLLLGIVTYLRQRYERHINQLQNEIDNLTVLLEQTESNGNPLVTTAADQTENNTSQQISTSTSNTSATASASVSVSALGPTATTASSSIVSEATNSTANSITNSDNKSTNSTTQQQQQHQTIKTNTTLAKPTTITTTATTTLSSSANLATTSTATTTPQKNTTETNNHKIQ